MRRLLLLRGVRTSLIHDGHYNILVVVRDFASKYLAQGVLGFYRVDVVQVLCSPLSFINNFFDYFLVKVGDSVIGEHFLQDGIVAVRVHEL